MPHTRLATKHVCASFIKMMISKRRTIIFTKSSTNLLTLSRFKSSILTLWVAKTWLIIPMGPSGCFNWLPKSSQRRTLQLKNHGSVRILPKRITGLFRAIAGNAFQGPGANQWVDLEHIAPNLIYGRSRNGQDAHLLINARK
jgi:hypothetical protein